MDKIVHKFFIEKKYVDNNKFTIIGEEHKHISKVLRLKVGDSIIINDFEGKDYIGEITVIDKIKTDGIICSELSEEKECSAQITLFQGIPKGDKFEYILQKGTEIGIVKFVPLVTNRVIVKINLNENKKIERWERIVLESAKQCKRTIIPKVENPIEFKNMVEELKNFDLVIVPYENSKNYGLKKLFKDLKYNKRKLKIALIVGPEGGFEVEEINILKEHGSKIITLGNRILRTETASIVASSLILYEYGDLGGEV